MTLFLWGSSCRHLNDEIDFIAVTIAVEKQMGVLALVEFQFERFYDYEIFKQIASQWVALHMCACFYSQKPGR